MGTLRRSAFLLVISWQMAFAQSIGTIKKIDLDNEKPKDPDYILLELDVTKPKKALAHIILRQLTNRVRVEFEGSGLARGNYVIALSSACTHGTLSAGRFKAGWKELHHFASNPTYISTERSQPGMNLKGLSGKALALLLSKGQAFDVVDCKPINK